MADVTSPPPRRSALEGHVEYGRFGAPADSGTGLSLQERRGLAIVHVDAWTDACRQALEAFCGIAPPEARHAVEKDGIAVMSVGPSRWLIAEKETRDLYAAIRETVTDDLAAVTDQGHSRVCWRIDGPPLRDLLSKGSTVDFHGASIGPGACIGTQLGHFTVTIQFRSDDSADIYGARSFAADLHHWLHLHSLEYGLTVEEPA